MKIPKSHPRYASLKTRELIEKGVRSGITSFNGLIAHGRGEAFDYLLGEKTHDFALQAIEAAAALLMLAKHPVISVNGNTAVLVPQELVRMSRLFDIPLEINLFHASEERVDTIKHYLLTYGAKKILLPEKRYTINYLESQRKYVNPNGIYKADVVFVPLEDGDRTEALIKNGKKVITIDINPLSRTAKSATITIVDNVTRVFPLLRQRLQKTKNVPKIRLETILKRYENDRMLREALVHICKRFS